MGAASVEWYSNWNWENPVSKDFWGGLQARFDNPSGSCDKLDDNSCVLDVQPSGGGKFVPSGQEQALWMCSIPRVASDGTTSTKFHIATGSTQCMHVDLGGADPKNHLAPPSTDGKGKGKWSFFAFENAKKFYPNIGTAKVSPKGVSVIDVVFISNLDSLKQNTNSLRGRN
jgi:hypothetical protein